MGDLVTFLPWIIRGAMIAGVALALYGIYSSIAEHFRDQGRAEVQADFDAYKAAAMKRASDLALLWAAQVDKTEAAARQRKENTDAAFNDLKARARALPPGPGVRVSGESARLFDDIAANANADPPRAPAEREAAPAPVPPSAETAAGGAIVYDESDFALWLTIAAEAYVDARNQWRACVDHYERLRQASPKE